MKERLHGGQNERKEQRSLADVTPNGRVRCNYDIAL